MSGLGVKRTCYNWFYKNNAVENVLKIITAQIDTTSDLIKGYDKPLIESVKKNSGSRRYRFMLNRTLLLKTSKILLNIRVTDIPLNYLEKKNIRTFLIISCQQGIDCFLYQNVSRKILNNWNVTIPSLRTSKELELSNLLIIPKL